jgi:hypothetical protein
LFQYALIFLYFGDDRFKFLGVLGIKYTDKIVITILHLANLPPFGKPLRFAKVYPIVVALANL